MKIKRFAAQDMRQALRMVRETLGEDAVILSNKTVDGGVELTAAIDLVTEEVTEESLRPQASMRARPASAPARAPARPVMRAERQRSDMSSHAPAAASTAAPSAAFGAGSGEPRPAPRRAAPRRPEAPSRQAKPQPVTPTPAQPDALAEMREEMQNMRRWLQAELSSMSWYDLGQRAPHTQELLQRLMQLGLTPDIAKRLAEQVSQENDPEVAWNKAMFFLSAELEVNDQDVLEQGGVIVLVGPTGVGKTTTIAKMAARYALRYGHRNVALVTTDNFRIGARDQLQTYGRILNVPVRSANDPASMMDVIDSLSDRRLILVDTAGMGRDNERFDEQIEILSAIGPHVTTLLTLSATTESTALEKALRLFAVTRPQACILTKLDEAASLGASMSAVIHAGLPLAYLADGQRVPEDLQVARSHSLVERAAELLEEHTNDIDEAYAAWSYKGNTANAHF